MMTLRANGNGVASISLVIETGSNRAKDDLLRKPGF
jgi:hypothetical protein